MSGPPPSNDTTVRTLGTVVNTLEAIGELRQSAVQLLNDLAAHLMLRQVPPVPQAFPTTSGNPNLNNGIRPSLFQQRVPSPRTGDALGSIGISPSSGFKVPNKDNRFVPDQRGYDPIISLPSYSPERTIGHRNAPTPSSESTRSNSPAPPIRPRNLLSAFDAYNIPQPPPPNPAPRQAQSSGSATPSAGNCNHIPCPYCGNPLFFTYKAMSTTGSSTAQGSSGSSPANGTNSSGSTTELEFTVHLKVMDWQQISSIVASSPIQTFQSSNC